MKYGILQIGILDVRLEEKKVNIGDSIQATAIRYIYHIMGIPEEEIIEISINDIMTWDGEYVILPININLSYNWCINIFPLPPKIIPVFLGFSYFSAEKFPDNLVNYFNRYSPIGCRDEATMKLFRSQGIEAYLFGCITAVLPRRNSSIQGTKTFFVDAPNSLKPFIPKSILENSENVIFSSHIYYGDAFLDINYTKEVCENLLKQYCTEAKLIVTSRLHCMSPCIAMGIPTIAVPENCSPRLGWIEKYIPIFSPERYNQIDWNPTPTNQEMIKEKLISFAIQRIQQTYEKFSFPYQISEFYEQREKSEYGNFYKLALKKLPNTLSEDFTYIIWGTGQIGINAYQVISETYPKSRMVLAVDSFCTGSFFGIEIEKPEEILHYPDAYVFIATYSGEKCAKDKLENYGKILYRDYMSLATKTG